jgi:hypothetical protein
MNDDGTNRKETQEELQARLLSLEAEVEKLLQEQHGDEESFPTQSVLGGEGSAGSRQTIIHFVDVEVYDESAPKTKAEAHDTFQVIIDAEWNKDDRKRDRKISHGDLIVIKGDPCLYYCFVGLVDRYEDSPAGYQGEAAAANIDRTLQRVSEAGKTTLELIVWSETYPGPGVNVDVVFSKTTLTPGTEDNKKVDTTIITDITDPPGETFNIKTPDIIVRVPDGADPDPPEKEYKFPTVLSFTEKPPGYGGNPCVFNTQKITTNKDPKEHFYIDTFKISSTTVPSGVVSFKAFDLAVTKDPLKAKPASTLFATYVNIDQYHTKPEDGTATPGNLPDPAVAVIAEPKVTKGNWKPSEQANTSDWHITSSDSEADTDCDSASFETNKTVFDDTGTSTPASIYSSQLTITNETPTPNVPDTIEMFDATHTWIDPEDVVSTFYFGAPSSAGSSSSGIGYPAWDNTGTYAVGDRFTHDGKVWTVTEAHDADPASPPGNDGNSEDTGEDPDKIYLSTGLNIEADCEDQGTKTIEVSEITALKFDKDAATTKSSFTVLTDIQTPSDTAVPGTKIRDENASEVTAIDVITGQESIISEPTVMKSLDGAYIQSKGKSQGDIFDVITSVGSSEDGNVDTTMVFEKDTTVSNCDDCLVLTPKDLKITETTQYLATRELVTHTEDHDFFVKGTPVKITTFERTDTAYIRKKEKAISVTEYTNQTSITANVSTLTVSKFAVDLKVESVKHKIVSTLRDYNLKAEWQKLPISLTDSTFNFDSKKLVIKRRKGQWSGQKKTASFTNYLWKFAQTTRTDTITAKKVVAHTTDNKKIEVTPWVLYFQCLDRNEIYRDSRQIDIDFDNPKTYTFTPGITRIRTKNQKLVASGEHYDFTFSNVYNTELTKSTTTIKHEDAKWVRLTPSDITITFENEKEVTLTPKQYEFIMEQKLLKMTLKELEIVYSEAVEYEIIPKEWKFEQFKNLIKYKPVTVTNQDGELCVHATECQTVGGGGGMGATTIENMGSVTIEPDVPPIVQNIIDAAKITKIEPGDPLPDTYPVDSMSITEGADPPSVNETIDSLELNCESAPYDVDDLAFQALSVDSGNKTIPDAVIHSSEAKTTPSYINNASVPTSDFNISDVDPTENEKNLHHMDIKVDDASAIPSAVFEDTIVTVTPLSKDQDVTREGAKVCVTDSVSHSDDSVDLHTAEYVKGTDTPQPDKEVASTVVSIGTDSSHTVRNDKFETELTDAGTSYDPMTMTSITLDEVESVLVSKTCQFSKVVITKNYDPSPFAYDNLNFDVNIVDKASASDKTVQWDGQVYHKVDIVNGGSSDVSSTQYKYRITATGQPETTSTKATISTETLDVGDENFEGDYFNYNQPSIEDSSTTGKVFLPLLDECPKSDDVTIVEASSSTDGGLIIANGARCVDSQLIFDFEYDTYDYTFECGVWTKTGSVTEHDGYLEGPNLSEDVYEYPIEVCVGGQKKTIKFLSTEMPDSDAEAVGRLVDITCDTAQSTP